MSNFACNLMRSLGLDAQFADPLCFAWGVLVTCVVLLVAYREAVARGWVTERATDGAVNFGTLQGTANRANTRTSQPGLTDAAYSNVGKHERMLNGRRGPYTQNSNDSLQAFYSSQGVRAQGTEFAQGDRKDSDADWVRKSA